MAYNAVVIHAYVNCLHTESMIKFTIRQFTVTVYKRTVMLNKRLENVLFFGYNACVLHFKSSTLCNHTI